jgi:hypothetical protein
MPPLPKPPHLLQRTNAVAGAARLPTAEASAGNTVPRLPPREKDKDGKPVRWHPMVVRWWASVWRSPMASEYLDADMRGGLYLLADLHQLRWTLRDSLALKEIAGEIRLQEVRFGLSPIDRSRLRWSIEQGETAAERTEVRRERKAPKASRDPRGVLKAV